jgi:phosphatidylinositol mannoside-binding LppM-like protein
MKTNFKVFTFFGALLLALTLYLSGCVNYDQKTTLNADGSGSMKVHYWSSMKNFSMGTTLGKFDFDEAKAKANYTSSNTEVKSCKMDDNLTDSTKHVNLDLTFKDINKISDAQGFNGVKVSWKEDGDNMKLVYTLLEDTSAAKQMGASDYKVTYEFEMPSEIVSTNGTKDAQKVKWNYTLADLGKDNDMTVVVKKGGKKLCGILTIFPAIFIIGLAYYTQRNRKKLQS